jgi:hypothetical protein
MKNWSWFMMGVITLCVLILLPSSALAQPTPLPDTLLNVTVAFGAGLNTSGIENQVVIPDSFRVKRNGVVHFMVAGFHQIAVYERGTVPEDIMVPDDPANQFIDDQNNLIFLGQSPTTPIEDFSNARNRVESVSFARDGNYLVICNVRSHFLAGMYAIVRVRR